MKPMIYITKLISKVTDKEVYLYISLEDLKKYTFIEKTGVYIPYNDKKLLDVINNVTGIMYEKKVDDNSQNTSDKEKKIRTTKEKIQRVLAGLGIAVTILTFEPTIVDGVSYVLKKGNSITHSAMIDEDSTNKEFLKQFEIAIDKNNNYTEKERCRIITGFSNYINDWGYLLNETDREYLLNLIENVKVNRNAWLPKWAIGDYFFKNINIGGNHDSLGVITHETCHAFSDRGLLLGSINGYGLGYALNEGINTCINDKYYSEDVGYHMPRKEVLKLSLLTSDEVLIETYQKKGAEHLIKTISKEIPGISYIDVLRYISMMDIALFIDEYKVLEDYKLPKEFYQEKNELYNKMFKAKYGYDYSETVMKNINVDSDCNFLDGNIRIEQETDIKVKKYNVPKEILAKKLSEVDIKKYLQEEKLINFYSNTLLILDPEITMFNYDTLDEFCKAFSKKYSDDEKDVEKLKSIFSEGINDNNFDYYMECTTQTILNLSDSPEYIACYFRRLYKNLKEETEIDELDEKFQEKMVSELTKYNMAEAIDLYLNSNIDFKQYTAFSPEKAVLPDEYRRFEKTNNYMITDRGILIAATTEGEELWSARYKDEKIYLMEVENEQDIEIYNEMFDISNGTYYSTNIYWDLNIDTIDESQISVYISHMVKTTEKTEESKKQK